MQYYSFHIGDYAKKTQHLTNEEDLCYRRLLDLYYDQENLPLTGGLATLSRRLRVSESALKNVLDEFFPDGKNQHADEKIAEYYAYLAKQSSNGKLGGRPKHKGEKPTANPPPTQNNPVPSQPLTINHKPETNISTTNVVESKQQRATRLPKDWEPSTEGFLFCKTKRPDLNARETLERFRDYWCATTKTKVDWEATWRNWVRNEKQVQKSFAQQKEDLARDRFNRLTGRNGNESDNRTIDI
jgi:uncharacterized protein YdaU (DUF1376 family)